MQGGVELARKHRGHVVVIEQPQVAARGIHLGGIDDGFGQFGLAAWAAVVSLAGLSALWVGSGPATVALGFSVELLVTTAALTAWRSHDVSAIAASAWALMILDALLAGAYGLLADIDANLIYATVATIGSLAILLRISIPDHVHARLVPLPAAGSTPDPDVSREDLSLVA